MTAPSITVALLTRNRLPLLRQTLEAVLAQLSERDEIVVVDTGSRDGTREWLDSLGDRVRWTGLDAARTDFGAARNAAVREARSDAVAFLDDDCLPAPDWLERIRAALARLDAVGGLALFGQDYRFPFWWSPELAWTIGMSGPSLIRGRADDYPSTSNLAAWRSEFISHPFQESGHGFQSANIYLGGREDAQWWAEARRRGARTGTDIRAVALHRIPQNRIAWGYIVRRARADGVSAWARRPCSDLAEAARHEAMDGLISAVGALARGGRGALRRAAAPLVWSLRQASLLREAAHPPGRSAGAVIHGLRRRSARIWYSGLRTLRQPLRVPDEPRRLLVAAPTFLGDSLLLSAAVAMLARSWPQAAIDVWTRYPRFFTGIAENVRTLTDAETGSKRFQEKTAPGYEVVFAPYYEFGDPGLWRQVLSRRGVTFDRETGFRRDRDYVLAARVVEKDFGSHELLNLVRLLSLWPLTGPLEKPVVRADDGIRAQLRTRHPFLADPEPYAALQMRSGTGMKDWPLERWAELASHFVRATGIRLVVHDPVEEEGVAARLIQMAGLSPTEALAVSCNLDELIALLQDASLAIGICSGPKHLAMAVGTPTFTLYGPTDPVRWGALFDRPLHAWVRSPAGTLTAREHHCLPVNHAMLQIPVDAALEGLIRHCAGLGLGRMA